MIKIPDIIRLNDWESKKFLRMVTAIQIGMIGAIGLDFMGIEIPIIRQAVGFIYLTFLPGTIILKILRVHKLGTVETLLFSVGLSISFLMFSGFFLNTILSFYNIDSPLSSLHVVIFIIALISLLCILSYKIDKFYQDEPRQFIFTHSTFYLMLLPVLSILSTYFVNFQKNNILLMILIILIALIPVFVFFRKIPSEQYPLLVFVIAVSLLFSYSLISMYLTGYDIHYEYYFHKQVVNSAFWNSVTWSNLNAMLSIVILPAIYSYFLRMDGAWVYKIVFPVIFSMALPGLYIFYKSQVKSDKIAFFSVFFFMSLTGFFIDMLSLARQQIAEFFFVILMYLAVNDTLNKNTRNILFMIFGASLVTSHYGLSYIYMSFIIFTYLFYIFRVRISETLRLKLPDFNLNKSTLYYFVIFYIVFVLIWYINFSSSSVFKSILDIGDHIYSSIFTDFYNPDTRNPETLMAIGLKDPINLSLGREIHRDLQFITQFFIIVGLLKIIIGREISKIKAEYLLLFVASFVMLLLSIILPNFASSLNISRVYQISLFALSPLFVIGGLFVIQKSIKFFKKKNEIERSCIILLLGVMIPYFLFNTGLVYEIIKDVPNPSLLGVERMKNDNKTKIGYYNKYTQEQDVYSARWYYKYKNADKEIYADGFSQSSVLVSYGMMPPFSAKQIRGYTPGEIPRNYYLYLTKLNICENTIITGYRRIANTSIISPLISNSAIVYSNGCGEIYKK